jgi:hypothetical protein
MLPSYGYRWISRENFDGFALLQEKQKFSIEVGEKASYEARVHVIAHEILDGFKRAAIKELRASALGSLKFKEFELRYGNFLPISCCEWNYFVHLTFTFISDILIIEKIEDAVHWKGFVVIDDAYKSIEVVLPSCRKWDELTYLVFQKSKDLFAYVRFKHLSKKDEKQAKKLFSLAESWGEPLRRVEAKGPATFSSSQL